MASGDKGSSRSSHQTGKGRREKCAHEEWPVIRVSSLVRNLDELYDGCPNIKVKNRCHYF